MPESGGKQDVLSVRKHDRRVARIIFAVGTKMIESGDIYFEIGKMRAMIYV